MARLLSPPVGLRPSSYKPLSGPETVGASADSTIGDFTQTVAAPYGAIAIQYGFPNIRGQMARRARGWITAMHGGANATRWDICDWDGLTFADAGMTISEQQKQSGLPWDNGSWENGKNWRPAPPLVAVAAAAARDDTIVSLSDTFWGWQLGVGDWIGFQPFHFGRYEITEELGDGQYRIWPRLRRDVATGDLATLRPVIAMRLMANNLPQAQRDAVSITGLTISLVEVFDYDVRTYFAD